MLANRLDEDTHAGYGDFRQLAAHGDTALGRRSAGAAVGDPALAIDGAEVAPHRHVAPAHGEVDAECFQDAPSDAILKGIVAEQAEVPRSAAGGDARQNRYAQAANAVPRTGVQVGRPCRLQFGLSAGFHGQSAQAIGDEQDDLAARGIIQLSQ